jgi:hypothetical protein
LIVFHRDVANNKTVVILFAFVMLKIELLEFFGQMGNRGTTCLIAYSIEMRIVATV